MDHSRAEQVYWAGFKVASLLRGCAQAESFASPAKGRSARLMLLLYRRCRFMEISVGLPRLLERARGRVGGGILEALAIELRALAVAIPRAAHVAVTDGADFLGLSAGPLPLRLRFLITSGLRDRGQSTSWSLCQDEKTSG